MKTFSFYTSIAALIIFIDRITKWWAINNCNAETISDKTPFFSCHLIFNRGISWSLLHSDNDTVFLGVGILTSIITALLFGYIVYNRNQPDISVLGGVLAVSGSVSNIIDRIIYHGVVDFILLSYHDYSFPIFNVADICIVVGILLVVIKSSNHS